MNTPPAHTSKSPPTIASEAYALTATGNKRAKTPGKTPRVQPPPPANPPPDDDGRDSVSASTMQLWFFDLRQVVELLGPAIEILLKEGLSSPIRLYQTAKTELDELFRANPEFRARDRTRLKCFRTLLFNVLPSDLMEREGIPTLEQLEDALNRQAEQAQAVAVAKSTPRREAP